MEKSLKSYHQIMLANSYKYKKQFPTLPPPQNPNFQTPLQAQISQSRTSNPKSNMITTKAVSQHNSIYSYSPTTTAALLSLDLYPSNSN